jgi:nucleoside-diphosphate kinase
MERTLVLLKPDAFHRAVIGKIISRLEDKGLQLVGAKLIIADDSLLDTQYDHLASQPFFEEIKTFMKSGPILVTCWEGVDCVKTVRLICGITNAREATRGTIRGDWAMSVMCNLVHCSDSRDNAQKEVQMYFRDEELLSYERPDISYLYSERERQPN